MANKLTISSMLCLVGIASCVQIDAQPDFDRTRHLIAESTGRAEIFDPHGPVLSQEDLDAILADGLSMDEALTLSLLNNRELQAEFQEIGVAHADWVQSQLLSNPSLDILLRSPSGGGRSLLESVISLELLQLWRIPIQEEIAGHQLEATVLRIARRAGEQLAETRAAYYAAVAAEQLRVVAEESVALASLSFESVKRRHQAGVADAFEENLARGPLLAAQLELQTAKIEAANAKRDLAKTISLKRPAARLLLNDALPLQIQDVSDTEALVKQALASRLDLRAIEASIFALDARVRLEEREAWGEATAGLSVERPPVTGGSLVGPSLSLTLPIFDQNQAQVARAGFQLQQLVKLHEAAQIDVSQNVRASADRVNAAFASLEFYAVDYLPQAQLAVALATESYAAGRTTFLALLQVQRQLLDAQRSHVTLRLEAAVAATDLERVLGAKYDI